MRSKRLSFTPLFLSILAPMTAAALVVDIQGTRLESQLVGGSCVDISGDYPGVRVETSMAGKTPRICYNSAQEDSITILNTLFVSKQAAKQAVSIKFEHEFPTGINGKIMARAKLQGFFSTANGVGIPSGDKVSLTAFFSQSGHDDAIGEAFDLTVGEQMDSALFDYSVKKPYLISGPRVLKGTLNVVFTQPGHKLTLREMSGISIDTGSSFEDKLETLEVPEDQERTVPDQGGPANVAPIPSPARSGAPSAPLAPPVVPR